MQKLARYFFFITLASSTLFGKSNLFSNFSIAGIHQGGKLEAQSLSNQAGAYFIVKNNYKANGLSGQLGFGVETFQGCVYLSSQLYALFNKLNDRIYFNDNGYTQDQINIYQGSGMGVNGKLGWNTNYNVIPFLSFGIECTQRQIKYKATNLPNSEFKKYNNPTFTFGFGMLGKVSERFSINIDVMYKHSKTFDIPQVPVSDGYPSLSGTRLRVSSDQIVVLLGVTYKIISL